MLDALFSFSGRINRLQYFLRVLGLGVGYGVLAGIAFASFVVRASHPSLPAMILVLLAMLAAVPVLLWASLSLQARRFRDIGWNPLYVICGLFANQMIELTTMRTAPLVAGVCVLISLGSAGCLLFWPSKADDGSEPDIDHDWSGLEPAPAPATPRTPRPAPAFQAGAAPTAPAWNAAPSPPSFGRRGL